MALSSPPNPRHAASHQLPQANPNGQQQRTGRGNGERHLERHGQSPAGSERHPHQRGHRPRSVELQTRVYGAEQHHLTFGPNPATHAYCTLGDMIGNNSCGIHSVMAGKTEDNVEESEALTYDGLRLRVGRTSASARTPCP